MRGILWFGLTLAVVALLAGCAGTGQTEATQESTPTTVPSVPPPAQPAPTTERAPDTVDATVHSHTPPAPQTEAPRQVPPSPAHLSIRLFGVQIGAYLQSDVAERIAGQTKVRFGEKVQMVPDKRTRMTKIFLGEFTSKEEARKFRDSLVRQFPGEYDDAWVSEIPVP